MEDLNDIELKEKVKFFIETSENENVKYGELRSKTEEFFGIKIKKSDKDRFKKIVHQASEELSDDEEEEEIIINKKKTGKKRKRKTDYDQRNKKKKLDYISLSKNDLKRVTINKYKGQTKINFRNYFQKDGEYFPTKKGICLSIHEWQLLKENIREIQDRIDEME